MSKRSLLLFLSFCFCLFSCDDRLVYNRIESIENSSWEKGQEYLFTFDIEDITIPYHVTLQLRNNNLYPYRNLWLTYNEIRPDSTSRQDTIEITLADTHGNWLGKGISIFETEYPLYRGYFFRQPGSYTYRINHLMAPSPLKGITEVGIKVETATQKNP
ncbi:MAG: gliding motility lipoprotein GldH [Tannerellaceae bacterium]|nr:gliding motility lipoprotein GldH [Tannerellaceae bacterium]